MSTQAYTISYAGSYEGTLAAQGERVRSHEYASKTDALASICRVSSLDASAAVLVSIDDEDEDGSFRSWLVYPDQESADADDDGDSNVATISRR